MTDPHPPHLVVRIARWLRSLPARIAADVDAADRARRLDEWRRTHDSGGAPKPPVEGPGGGTPY